MEATVSYFRRIIIFPASDFIWVPPFFYTTPIFSHQRRHVQPGRGLSRAGLAGIVRVGCLRSRESWADRGQASFKEQVWPAGRDRPAARPGEPQGKDLGGAP